MNFSNNFLLNNSIEDIEQSMENFNINTKRNLFHYYDVTTSQTWDNENPPEQCSNICTESYVASNEMDLIKTPMIKKPLLIPTAPIKKTKQQNRNGLKPKKLTYENEIDDRDSGVVLENKSYRNSTGYTDISSTIKYNIFQQENKRTGKVPNTKGLIQNSNILLQTKVTRSMTKKLQLYNKNNENNIQEIRGIVETPRNIRNSTTKAICNKKSTNCNKKKPNFSERKEYKINDFGNKENDHSMQILSQYNGNGTWKDKLQWLQPRRDIGLWIECCRKNCKKWRYTTDYHDPTDVPIKWYCEMNSDVRLASCTIPEVPKSKEIERDLIENKYNAGSIVWAKKNTYLWWPAIVDDCPIKFRYYELKKNSIIPVKYHVVFFDLNELTHSWVKCKSIKPFSIDKNNVFLKKASNTVKYKNKIKESYDLACSAIPMTILERLKRFSFLALHESKITLTNNGNKIASTSNYKNSITTNIKMASHNDIKRSNAVSISNLLNLIDDLDEIIPSSQPKLDATIKSKKKKLNKE
ncbi:uncharacterized protein LOC122520892 [Polistes fuscatus]|uniref:uncharacterized protein LOC122520892 n=1 Tax=Polistes fuscatus TaxID=30207 RepID=UPI001CA85B9B|nr:uncharacterized protein LOC122520892 [Polistes fuscatus]